MSQTIERTTRTDWVDAAYRAAWDQGCATADRKLKPGLLWLGAGEEAIQAGHAPRGLCHALFVRAFLMRAEELFPSGVLLDADRIIT